MEAENRGRKIVGIILIVMGIILLIGLIMRLTGNPPIRTGDDVCFVVIAPFLVGIAIYLGRYLLKTDAH